ncbi:ras-related protein Rab-28-like [Dysidea avara]|uniref:ras-related protein Rab-28-like n=1 Tax=Dysidea avara TaxID=196820 RepID=UPI00333329F1
MADSDDEGDKKDYQIKVVVLGDGTTGKTSLITRFSQNHFGKTYQQTVGLDFFLKRILLPGDVHVTLQVWDIGGQTIGGKMIDNYVSGAEAVLFIYDITNYTSFENLDDWLAVVKRTFRGATKLPHMALVGNKSDLEHMRTVRKDRHEKFAKDNHMSSHSISAKTSDKVNNCFKQVAADVLHIKLTPAYLEETDAVITADVVRHTPHQSMPTKLTTKTRSSVCVLQ